MKGEYPCCKVYDIINQRIIELLEHGATPWRKWNEIAEEPVLLQSIESEDIRGKGVYP
jgi:hypothetical protein